jgi:hypothetical protein
MSFVHEGTIVSGLLRSDNSTTLIITLMSGNPKGSIPLMHLRGADQTPAHSKSKPRGRNKSIGVEDLMTLKQACPSEYQGAQGAFKDSMIH